MIKGRDVKANSLWRVIGAVCVLSLTGNLCQLFPASGQYSSASSQIHNPIVFGLPHPHKDDVEKTLATNKGSWGEVTSTVEMSRNSCKEDISYTFYADHTVRIVSCSRTDGSSTESTKLWSTSETDGDVWLTIGSIRFQVIFFNSEGGDRMQLRLFPGATGKPASTAVFRFASDKTKP
jgi:hypothetical protein